MKSNLSALTALSLLSLLMLSGCGPKLTLKAIEVAPATVESSVTTTTAATVMAEQQAVLNFGVTGRIARIAINAGDRVKKGQILAQLENMDLRTVFEDAERELKRAQELRAAGLVSQAAFDDSRRAVEIARANFDKTVIRAPFDGVITEQNLELGEQAQLATSPGAKAPLRIVDTKPRLVRGDIDEVDLSKIHIGTPARVKIQAVGTGWLPAQVQKVVPFVSTVKEKDRTSEIELKITSPEAERIPVGASVDVELITERRENVLSIPARVLLGTSAQRYVYVANGDRLHKTLVKTGIGNYARTEIVSGLKAGDVVVFPPADVDLKDDLQVKIEKQPWP